VDQDHGGRVEQAELPAFVVQSVEYSLGDLCPFFSRFPIQQDQKFVAADAIDRQTRIPQDDTHPM
jgi:hypothetical protein